MKQYPVLCSVLLIVVLLAVLSSKVIKKLCEVHIVLSVLKQYRLLLHRFYMKKVIFYTKMILYRIIRLNWIKHVK